jgi:O-antigen ligase
MSKSDLSVVSKLLAGTALLATILVTPWFTIDAINIPKLVVITLGGFMCLGALVKKSNFLGARKFRPLIFFSLIFLIDLVLVFFLAGTNPAQEFFGTYGRSTGLLAYFSLGLLLVAAAVGYSDELLERIKKSLLLSGGLSLAYGIVQAIGLDPFDWANPYSPVFGFLGNPNFQASFLGLVSVFSLALMLGSFNNLPQFSVYAVYQLVSLYVIYRTDSQQGFLVYAGGTGIIFVLWIRTSKFKVFAIPAYAMAFIGFVFASLGSLNSGPLASLLYKDSVSYRGDYWRAGIKMGLDNPIFGVGLDSYGDWYRRARSIDATLRRGPEITSNAAHNVVIDFFANGGFPLAIIYLCLMGLVIRSIFLVIRRTRNFDPTFVGLVAVWCGYQAQSIISLNQLGLAVWGWIISGLIIGYEIKSRDDQGNPELGARSKKGKTPQAEQKQELPPATLMRIIVGLIFGAVAVLPTFIVSVEHKAASESGNFERILGLAYKWPMEPFRMGQVAIVFTENKYEKEALKVIADATEKFPNEFKLWELLFNSSVATEAQKTAAKLQMKRLDPLNPTLK